MLHFPGRLEGTTCTGRSLPDDLNVLPSNYCGCSKLRHWGVMDFLNLILGRWTYRVCQLPKFAGSCFSCLLMPRILSPLSLFNHLLPIGLSISWARQLYQCPWLRTISIRRCIPLLAIKILISNWYLQTLKILRRNRVFS